MFDAASVVYRNIKEKYVKKQLLARLPAKIAAEKLDQALSDKINKWIAEQLKALAPEEAEKISQLINAEENQPLTHILGGQKDESQPQEPHVQSGQFGGVQNQKQKPEVSLKRQSQEDPTVILN